MTVPQPDPDTRKRIAALRADPFGRQVIQSPWHPVEDVASLHRPAKELLLARLAACREPAAVRCVTVAAPPGFGKTHLLAWLRQACAISGSALFAHVTPYTDHARPGGFEAHVARDLSDSLFHRSPDQRDVRAAAERLVARADGGDPFDVFRADHPPGPEDGRPDRDALAAALRLLDGAGGPHGEPGPATAETVRDAACTLSRLAGRPLVLAFDQMEDTYAALLREGRSGADFGQEAGPLLRALLATPGLLLVFMFQLSEWQEFRAAAPGWLVDRLTEGPGVIPLQPLDDPTACEMIASRMRPVWDRLAPHRPPTGDVLFPFYPEYVGRMRRAARSDLRAFLRRAADAFAFYCDPDSRPHLRPRPAMAVVGVDPSEVPAGLPATVTARVAYLPAEVEVEVNSRWVVPVVCDPRAQAVTFPVPPLTNGPADVLIRGKGDPANAVRFPLPVADPEPTRPYAESIDREKLKARRRELNLRQHEVAERVGVSTSYISNIETGRAAAADDVYLKLAEALGQPLRRFRKSS